MKHQTDKLKVAICGVAGIPAKYGGFETFTEYLVKYCTKIHFTIYCESRYQEFNQVFENADRNFISFKANGVSSLFYDVFGIFHALYVKKVDIVVLLGCSGCWCLLHGFPGVLIGKNVLIRNKNLIRIGRLTRIEANCELDGYGTKGVVIGSNCKLGRFTIVRVPGDPNTPGQGVEIGDGTTFAEFCFVGGAGFVRIGSNNSIGQYVSFHPQNHQTAGKNSGTTNIGIEIGNNNWIGAKATILDGVTIGNNNIIGAMTLINKDVMDFQTHVGVPNKLI